MSLEQALVENTATMKQLIAVLSTVAESEGGVEAPKRKRRTKAEIEADAAAEAVAAAPVAAAPVAAAPVAAAPVAGSRWFHLPANNTVYEIKPETPYTDVKGSVQITEAEYHSLKAEYAKKFAHLAAPTADASPVSLPTSEATQQVAITLSTISDKLMAIHKEKGNAGVKPILDHFGAANVPALATKDLNAVNDYIESLALFG